MLNNDDWLVVGVITSVHGLDGKLKIKSLSDEIIYHPVKYKVLFGSKADTDLQGTFKVV